MEAQILERLDRLEEMLSKVLLAKQEWLTVQEFAKVTGLNSKYVSELCKTGKLIAAKSEERHGPHHTWRIRQTELERYQRDGIVTTGSLS